MSLQLSGDTWCAVGLIAVSTVCLASTLLRPATESERVKREGGTVFLGTGLMHRGYAVAQPLVRLLAAARVPPDLISWTSFLLGIGSGVALGYEMPGLGACLLALSGLGDLLDGAVARASGRARPAGAVLDSVLDRYVEASFLGGMMVYLDGYIDLQLLCLATLLGSFMVTYSTAKAEALGLPPPRGWMKRPERMVWLIYGTAASAIAEPLWENGTTVLAGILGLIALFSNLSAIWRLKVLSRTAARR